MNEEPKPIEPALRTALHEAAGQVHVETSTLDIREPAPVRRSRGRLVPVGVGVLALVIAGLGAFVATSGGDSNVKIRAGSATPSDSLQGEVPPVLLPASDADLVVYMRAGATEADVTAVRVIVQSSSDVRAYTFVDQAAAYAEFATMYCANPDLVDSVRPEDLPVSFRIVTADADATARLRTSLTGLPGVDTVVRGSDSRSVTAPPAADPGGQRGAVGGAPCNSNAGSVPAVPVQPAPSTTIPPLPAPTGPPPDDVDAARNAVAAAYTQAYSGTNSIETRRAAMQDSDVLKPQLDQARAGNTQTVDTMTITVGDITFLDQTRAAVIYHLTLLGSARPDTVGIAVLDNGTWKVARETTCQILQLAAVQCPSP